MPNSIISISAPVKNNNESNIATASTLDELLACVPRAFQPNFRPVLREYHDVAVKLSHAQTALENFRKHEAGGTFPPIILGGLKTPVVQFSKEYSASSQYQTWSGNTETELHSIRRTFLASAVRVKTEEVDYLRSLISDSMAKTRSDAACKLAWDSLSTTFATGVNDKGATTYSNFFVDEYTTTKSNGRYWLLKAVAIGLAKHHRELTAKLAKLSIKKDTDVEMGNLPTNDVKRTIDEAVARALQAHNKQKKSMNFTDESRSSLTLHRTTQESVQKTEPQPQTSSSCGTRKRKREWEQETQEEVARLSSRLPLNFKVQDTFSYPEGFFQACPEVRTRFMLLHSSTEFVNSFSTFQADAFLGPGVDLPGDIKMQLALNGKFCLHAQKNNKLVPEAFEQLRRTLRIKLFFMDKKGSKGNYIPRFHVKSDWEPPTATPGLEEAISAMEAALLRQVSALPHKAYLMNPETKPLKEFLARRKYLVKITDKNLGLAVVTSQWYIDQCQEHLRNTIAYAPRQIKLDSLKEKYDLLLQSGRWTPAIFRYLETATCDVPRFHVIPKVHKQPWSSRPIIPSHSWITSKASEVVDYFLQPTVKETVPILQSTRHFLSRLRQQDLDLGEDVWLVTGDVKAMYTNIPPAEAISVVDEILQKSRKGHRSNGAADLIKLLEFVLQNNCFNFLEDSYIQKSGLAMGTACAPAVANLYCAKYEQELTVKYPHMSSRVLFYGRYIDDVFVLFRGTKGELHTFFRGWKIPGLEISWDFSKKQIHFLDVQLSIREGRLVTSLYEKTLNKHMYIPFSSAHPLSVKKAMVKAERSRYRFICSLTKDYERAEKSLFHNLLRRGYPLRLLESWFSQDLKPLPRTDKVLLLPSVYNPVWEYINMGNLERAFYSNVTEPYLNEYLRSKLGKLTLGLRRGWNMYDIFNRENLTILDGLCALGEI